MAGYRGGQTVTQQQTGSRPYYLRLLFIPVVTVAVAEFFVMLFLSGDAPLTSIAYNALKDSLLLALITVPVVHFFIVRPFVRQQSRQAHTDHELLKLSRAVEQSSAIVFTTDTHGNFNYVNKKFTEVTGYRPEEVLGKKTSLLKSGKQTTDAYQGLWEALNNGKDWRGEFENSRKNGEVYSVSSLISPIRNRRGETTHYLAIQEDITRRKAAEAKLARHLRELDSFAHAVAHDLKAPLFGIARLAQWLKEDLGDDISQDVQGHLMAMERRVERLTNLISALLDYARLGQEVSVENINVQEMLVRLIDLLSPPRDFRVTIHEPMPVVQCNRALMHQVFQNLLSNAIKFRRPEGGQVDIYADDLSDRVAFTVKDNGPGIPPEMHDKIFEFFQTLAPKDKIEGSGIGLALVRRVIEDHGGNITVKSQPGEGAAFHFTWPKKPCDPRQSNARAHRLN